MKIPLGRNDWQAGCYISWGTDWNTNGKVNRLSIMGGKGDQIMLAFISDIHLTDGTSGETIHSGAFRKFALYLKDMVETAEAKELEIVLLGDIFDVIRSNYWLRSGIRPWSDVRDKDGEGKGVKDYTIQIVNKICRNRVNKESITYLKDFKEQMAKEGVLTKITYIIGNHDWLVNRHPEARATIARFLGMENATEYKNNTFPTEGFWEGYRVFARHGDIYDPFNFDEDRNASSLGDAIVIDLVNRFPKEVESAIGRATDPNLVSQLREIDNVRPLIDIPLWVHGACRKAISPETGKKVKEIWNKLVKDFLKIKFVKQHDKPWRMDAVDALQLGLGISTFFSIKDIVNFPIRKLYKKSEDYVNKAFHEEHVKRNMAEFVVYGHTHHHQVVPLDLVPMPGEILQKTYFNTGTWRRAHEKATFGVEDQEFLSRHVMTFIAFYQKEERKNHKFEVWNGALG
jgi:UDP-2,3-diacylglucosamine pyrophosphatase LpxH